MKKSETKTVATKTVKNANSTKVVNLQLSQFAKKLESVEVKEKKDKLTIYNYPETFSKTDINSEKGKKFRNSLRSKMQKFANNIFYYAKINDNEKLIAEINSFDAHYKENYRLNDYSLKSVSSSNNEVKAKDIELMLSIIKEVKAQTK